MKRHQRLIWGMNRDEGSAAEDGEPQPKRPTPAKAPRSATRRASDEAQSSEPTELSDVLPILIHHLPPAARRALGAACRAASATHRAAVIAMRVPWPHLPRLAAAAGRFPGLRRLEVLEPPYLGNSDPSSDTESDDDAAPLAVRFVVGDDGRPVLVPAQAAPAQPPPAPHVPLPAPHMPLPAPPPPPPPPAAAAFRPLPPPPAARAPAPVFQPPQGIAGAGTDQGQGAGRGGDYGFHPGAVSGMMHLAALPAFRLPPGWGAGADGFHGGLGGGVGGGFNGGFGGGFGGGFDVEFEEIADEDLHGNLSGFVDAAMGDDGFDVGAGLGIAGGAGAPPPGPMDLGAAPDAPRGPFSPRLPLSPSAMFAQHMQRHAEDMQRFEEEVQRRKEAFAARLAPDPTPAWPVPLAPLVPPAAAKAPAPVFAGPAAAAGPPGAGGPFEPPRQRESAAAQRRRARRARRAELAWLEKQGPLPELTPALCAAAASLKSLRVIALPRGAHVGPTGAGTLAAGLGQLRALDLAGRGVGPAGARSLAALTTLEVLHLGWSHVGTEAACALTALTALRTLSLPGNFLDARAAASLAGALTKLESLDVSSNFCLAGAAGAAAAAAIGALPALRSLDASAAGLGAEGLRALWRRGGGAGRLAELDVSYNQDGVLDGLMLSPQEQEQVDSGATIVPPPPRPLRGLRALACVGVGVSADAAGAAAALPSLAALRLSCRNDVPALRAALAPLRARDAVFWE